MKNIVILGAGFGGIKAANLLHRYLKHLGLLDRYAITIIDRHPYHTYAPLLYEVAATSKEIANQCQLASLATIPLEKIFQNKKISVVTNVVTKVDVTDGDIHFQDGQELKFDYLILALGAETYYSSIPGLKENSLSLKTFIDALTIRDKIYEAILEKTGNQQIKIIVGGAGATGVELASEIQSWLCGLPSNMPKYPASVSLIEANETILTGLNPRIVQRAEKRLRRVGINLITGKKIKSVELKKIYLESGQMLDYDILIWTGGVKAVSLMETMPLKKETRGKTEVQSEMECLPQTPDLKLYGKIYGLGDAVCFFDPLTNKPAPLLAQAAMEQAAISTYNLVQDLLAEEELIPAPRHRHYQPKNYPYILPLGGKYAIAKIGPIILSGFPAWILKGLVELRYFILNIMPLIPALKMWLKGLWIFTRNDRLG